MKTKKRQEEGEQGRIGDQGNLLSLYHECIYNAEGLMREAMLLFEGGYHVRSFALAYTAFEEIGKSQVVADAYYGLVALDELKDAFRRHDLKAAYLNRTVSVRRDPNGKVVDTIEYNPVDARLLFQKRQCSLYVGIGNHFAAIRPQEIITAEVAEEMLNTVAEELHAIEWAEELNGRIGTKGLWK